MTVVQGRAPLYISVRSFGVEKIHRLTFGSIGHITLALSGGDERSEESTASKRSALAAVRPNAGLEGINICRPDGFGTEFKQRRNCVKWFLIPVLHVGD